VDEAVMQMDLADQPLLMFRNRKSGTLNVVIGATTAITVGSIRASRAWVDWPAGLAPDSLGEPVASL
jgi:Sigma 54 modulation/S30EA ribosomal protein C terminus